MPSCGAGRTEGAPNSHRNILNIECQRHSRSLFLVDRFFTVKMLGAFDIKGAFSALSTVNLRKVPLAAMFTFTI